MQIHNTYQTRGGEDTVASAEAQLLQSVPGISLIEFRSSNASIKEPTEIRGKWKLARETVWSRDLATAITQQVENASVELVHVHNTFPLLSPAALQAARSSEAAVVQTLHNFRISCVRADFLRNGEICEACLGSTVPLRGVIHRCYHDSVAQSAVVAAMIGFHNVRGTYDRDVDAFIALTEFGRRKAIEGGLDPERVHVKPNFLEAEIEVGSHPRTGFAFVGRIAREKGVSQLVEAARGYQGLKISVAGGGPLQDMVEQAFHAGTIDYRGALPRDEVLALLRGVRALVFPSIWYEGFPMTILEAFASGTPVIASRIGGIPEIVEDGKTGLLVTPGDVEDLRHALRWADGHPEEMANMGVAARETFEAKYTAEKNLPQLLAIYEAAIAYRKEHPPKPRWPVRRV